ncbi:hypothetical protein A3D71_02780 [Candidatus Kaiserbacteria bacterium RIFCSPHIGHO2_02_FULL_55_20]|uniref:DUF5666 domain-containing protein n=1 Tax=Candidatus Kaiserbacteria bacterium RIFCSPHIGHO2_02_FULL_55_20 TaxID=1798497 RepID=A0A1F6DYT4_9BACT|nr:MAG: hypothetical protein A2680_00120 [Candidatus Kaiserbacteria bacterium RIFCSPHIGHO2_01_FULL_55_37]OGG66558.1 MAG: hypothetical protein A3D71_02780 [Candidatus Kaiserbacteria bacterium RIFCSPHIGHO2_02_FULL_55_20]
MNRIQTVLGSAALTSLLMVAPLIASADTLNANASSGVVISPSGIVRVIGADVTAVSNNVVNAVTHFGNVVLNWVVNVSASTSIAANGSKNATTTDVKVGDKVSFTGSLASSAGNVLTVAATKVRDLTSFPLRKIAEGTVSNVNTANGTFTLTHDGRTVTVQTNASTTIAVKGGTTTLASLTAGAKVNVAGTLSADGSVITAARIIVQTNNGQKGNDSGSDDDRNGKGEGRHGLRAGLNFLGGLHLGFGKKDK